MCHGCHELCFYGIRELHDLNQSEQSLDGPGPMRVEHSGKRRYLIQGVDETLEAGKVSDQLEDPHDSHDSHQSDNLTSLAHYLKVLAKMMIIMVIIVNVKHTCNPPITRSNMKGIIAKKSTKFMGCLKNLHFLGEHMNLTRYSIRKNKTITFSENKTKSLQRQPLKGLI